MTDHLSRSKNTHITNNHQEHCPTISSLISL